MKEKFENKTDSRTARVSVFGFGLPGDDDDDQMSRKWSVINNLKKEEFKN